MKIWLLPYFLRHTGTTPLTGERAQAALRGDLVAVWAEANQARDVCEVAAAGRLGTVGSGPVALRGRPRRFGSRHRSRSPPKTEQFRDAPEVIGQPCCHGWCACRAEMLAVTQLLMGPTEVVGTPDQIHSRLKGLHTLDGMPTFPGERSQTFPHGLDRDTARPHSLRSARFRIPSTEPAVQFSCNGLSTVFRLSFGLIPTVIRIQTSHSYSDLDCCHPSPQSSH